MLKIFMPLLVTLILSAPCAATTYEVTDRNATLNFYVHPGPLWGSKTWSGDTYQPSSMLKMEIPTFTMYPRVYPETRQELTISDPNAKLTWRFGDQKIRFTAHNSLDMNFISYDASYSYHDNSLTREYVRFSLIPIQNKTTVNSYCPSLSYADSDSNVSEITVRSRVTLTGMYDSSSYNSNMAEMLCDWTLKPRAASINVWFADGDILALKGVSGRPITGQFRVAVTTAGATGGYVLKVVSGSNVSIRESGSDTYTNMLELTRPDKVSYDSTTIGVKIEPAGAGSYVHNIKVTATLL